MGIWHVLLTKAFEISFVYFSKLKKNPTFSLFLSCRGIFELMVNFKPAICCFKVFSSVENGKGR